MHVVRSHADIAKMRPAREVMRLNCCHGDKAKLLSYVCISEKFNLRTRRVCIPEVFLHKSDDDNDDDDDDDDDNNNNNNNINSNNYETCITENNITCPIHIVTTEKLLHYILWKHSLFQVCDGKHSA